MEYISANLTYPADARKNGTQGKVLVKFVVNKKGGIQDIELLEEIGFGCGEEVERVVKTMNNMPQKWIPGKNEGKTVNVVYTLPIVFKL